MKEKPIAEIRDGAVYVLQPGTPVYLKTADVCRMIGKSNQWVGQLTAQGILTKDQTKHGGLYEATKTVSSYLHSIEDRIDEDTEKDKKIDRARKLAETRIKASKARMAQLDVEERDGNMHRSEDVSAMFEEFVSMVRSGLTSLPSRLARQVACAETPLEVAAAIEEEVRKLLEDLSKYRYDPGFYEERVRERLKLKTKSIEDDDEI